VAPASRTAADPVVGGETREVDDLVRGARVVYREHEDEVLRADVLSDLYGTPVDVVRTMGRIVIVGANEAHEHHPGEVDPHADQPDDGRI